MPPIAASAAATRSIRVEHGRVVVNRRGLAVALTSLRTQLILAGLAGLPAALLALQSTGFGMPAPASTAMAVVCGLYALFFPCWFTVPA
ncbi:MAG: hypothetical protein M5R42_03440 [Rhodocyclaceae bacterium]|nr:hypothetical protein [Rhodocyclaceae bacterium]